MKMDDVIYNIDQRKMGDRLEEFKKRKKFRLWKVGKNLENKQDWWNVISIFVPSLIFDNEKPKPISVSVRWINGEAYYDEGWILNRTWEGTPYVEYSDLLREADRKEETDKKVWERLQKISDVITTYEIPEKEPHRTLFIRAARSYAICYFKGRLITDNLDPIIKFLKHFGRLPTKDEWEVKGR